MAREEQGWCYLRKFVWSSTQISTPCWQGALREWEMLGLLTILVLLLLELLLVSLLSAIVTAYGWVG